jgi:hypothetical protein
MSELTHQYGSMSEVDRKEFNKGFLMDTISYSKVASFCRNEKAFERSYIYNEKFRKSASTIAGSAYHEALEHFFLELYEGNKADIVQLERVAFAYIDEVDPNSWKTQKTTPTVEECEKKANKLATQALSNFYNEISVYLEDIKQVLSVEIYCKEFLIINGVEIPLEFRTMIDLAYINFDDLTVITDHKLKASHSDEKEMKMSIGMQAITNTLAYESATGRTVDEVRFVENKYSKNKDASKPQINTFIVKMDKDTRRLYELKLYEGVKRTIEAVSNPDYVYLINDSDNFVDQAELQDFWCKTMTLEVEEFQYVPEEKKELISRRLKKVRDASIKTIDPNLIKKFKQSAVEFIQYDLSNSDMTLRQKIEHVLRTFGVIVNVTHEFDGYSSNTFLLEVSAGVRIDAVYKSRKEIANVLNVANVRVPSDLVVYEGKSYVCIETAKKRERDLIYSETECNGMKIPIGKDNFKQTLYWDLDNQSTPHMIVGGATGSGKSVFVDSTLEYILKAGVSQVDILDPKYEFNDYSSIPGVTVYQEIEDIEKRAKELVDQMNAKIKSGDKSKAVIIFDEMSDAFGMARKGAQLDIKEMVKVGYYKATKEKPFPDPKMELQVVDTMKSLKQNMASLLQKGRSSGVRIIAATQHPSAKTIDGNLKANLPVQVCFRVAKAVNSTIIIGETGGEALAGNGDGLINSPEYLGIQRFQSFWKK